jgi:hypothetical protein
VQVPLRRLHHVSEAAGVQWILNRGMNEMGATSTSSLKPLRMDKSACVGAVLDVAVGLSANLF